MKAGPSKATELLVGWLLPPASREHVLGDLHERYTTRWRYMAEVISVVPLVILSNIRRTLDPVVLLMEAFTFFMSFLIAGWSLGPGSFLYHDLGFLRVAIPTAVASLGLVLADAYANPRKRSPMRPVLGAVFSLLCVLLSQMTLSGSGGLALPRFVMVAGSSMALLLVSTLRLLFPPPADRPRGANGPAYWRRTELAYLRLMPKPPSTALEYVAIAVLVAVILILAFNA